MGTIKNSAAFKKRDDSSKNVEKSTKKKSKELTGFEKRIEQSKWLIKNWKYHQLLSHMIDSEVDRVYKIVKSGDKEYAPW